MVNSIEMSALFITKSRSTDEQTTTCVRRVRPSRVFYSNVVRRRWDLVSKVERVLGMRVNTNLADADVDPDPGDAEEHERPPSRELVEAGGPQKHGPAAEREENESGKRRAAGHQHPRRREQSEPDRKADPAGEHQAVAFGVSMSGLTGSL